MKVRKGTLRFLAITLPVLILMCFILKIPTNGRPQLLGKHMFSVNQVYLGQSEDSVNRHFGAPGKKRRNKVLYGCGSGPLGHGNTTWVIYDGSNRVSRVGGYNLEFQKKTFINESMKKKLLLLKAEYLLGRPLYQNPRETVWAFDEFMIKAESFTPSNTYFELKDI